MVEPRGERAMVSRRVRATAFGAASLKALERYVPSEQRLFDDPYAERILGGFPAFVVRHRALRRPYAWLMERAEPGLIGGMACRSRAIDDAARAALAGGTAQVVVLGAGFDTRAYRLEEMRPARVWELDLPEVQAAKRAAVTRVLGAVPPNVRFVPIDLTRQRPGPELAAHGFDPRSPALVLWEGVSQYLPMTAVEDTFRFVESLAAGSRFVFTYLLRRARSSTRPTGFEPGAVRDLLATFGLTLLDDLGCDEYRQRYLVPRQRTLTVFTIERVAVAEVD
jgi:methyltransferase (TIGR00027 family)